MYVLGLDMSNVETRPLYLTQAIKEKGLRIPEDNGLVGYDDIPFSSLISPVLTMIKLKKQELGVESFKLLFSRISRGRKKTKKIRLDVELKIRES